MTSEVADQLRDFLIRTDGQEDIAFAVWQPSTGATRTTAIINSVVLPRSGDRQVHGNASFNSQFFLRAANEAALAGGGVALLHSHPRGSGWQPLSGPDRDAESGHAAQAQQLTGLPLVGLTLAGDGTWSARFWRKTAPRTYEPAWCTTVREVGTRIRVSFNDDLLPAPTIGESTLRTREALGDVVFRDLTRLRVGVIGAGNIGAQVGEALARSGFTDVGVMDFDTAKKKNLDRTLHTYLRDVILRRGKAWLLVQAMRSSSNAEAADLRYYDLSICEPEGFAVASDFDLIFCCVDRPWARQVCNALAYAHLIPVVDGGVDVDAAGGRLRDARMRAHLVAPGRKCLACIGQYDPADVQLDRDGSLDSPEYLRNLLAGHRLLRGANVYSFGALTAGLELLQALVAFVAPSGQTDYGAQLYSAKTGRVIADTGDCDAQCTFTHVYAAGGDAGTPPITGTHDAANVERAERQAGSRAWRVRLGRLADDQWRKRSSQLDRLLVRIINGS
jgi:hypothetical protein